MMTNKQVDLIAVHPQKVGDKCYLLHEDKRFRNGIRWQKAIITKITDDYIQVGKFNFREVESSSSGEWRYKK